MNSLLSSFRAAAVAAIFVSFVDGSAVAATNLVTNGGFETGNFSGWTQGGNTNSTFVTGGQFAHSGSYGAALGPVFGAGTLSQTFSTVVGESYDLRYFITNIANNDGDSAPSLFEVTWNGSLLLGSSLIDSGPFGFSDFNFSGIAATTTSTTLQFTFQHTPFFWGLDDVSVVQRSISIPGTPDSGSTIALLGLALTLVACVRRRLA